MENENKKFDIRLKNGKYRNYELEEKLAYGKEQDSKKLCGEHHKQILNLN